MPKKIEQLNTPLPRKKDGRSKNGGARANSGPVPRAENVVVQELKTLIEQHGKEMVEIETADGRIISKARTLALLDRLFFDGRSGNTQATKEYLDRVIGKPPQTLAGDPKNPLMKVDIHVDSTIHDKYASHPSAEGHSGGSPPLPGS